MIDPAPTPAPGPSDAWRAAAPPPGFTAPGLQGGPWRSMHVAAGGPSPLARVLFLAFGLLVVLPVAVLFGSVILLCIAALAAAGLVLSLWQRVRARLGLRSDGRHNVRVLRRD